MSAQVAARFHRFFWYLIGTAYFTPDELKVVIAAALVQNIPIHYR
jgi:hypothetical protein